MSFQFKKTLGLILFCMLVFSNEQLFCPPRRTKGSSASLQAVTTMPSDVQFIVKLFDPNGNIAPIGQAGRAFLQNAVVEFQGTEKTAMDFLNLLSALLAYELLQSPYVPVVKPEDIFGTVVAFYNNSEKKFYLYVYAIPKKLTSTQGKCVDLFTFAKRHPEEWLQAKVFGDSQRSFMGLPILTEDGWSFGLPILPLIFAVDHGKIVLVGESPAGDCAVIDTIREGQAKLSTLALRVGEQRRQEGKAALIALGRLFKGDGFVQSLIGGAEKLHAFTAASQREQATDTSMEQKVSDSIDFMKGDREKNYVVIFFMPSMVAGPAGMTTMVFSVPKDKPSTDLFIQAYKLGEGENKSAEAYETRIQKVYELLSSLFPESVQGGDPELESIRRSTMLSMRASCIAALVPGDNNPDCLGGSQVLSCADRVTLEGYQIRTDPLMREKMAVAATLFVPIGRMLARKLNEAFPMHDAQTVARLRLERVARDRQVIEAQAAASVVAQADQKAQRADRQAQREMARKVLEDKKKADAQAAAELQAFKKDCDKKADFIQKEQADLLVECEGRKTEIYQDAARFVEEQVRAGKLQASISALPQVESEKRDLILTEELAEFLELEIQKNLLKAREAFAKTETSLRAGTEKEIVLEEGSSLKAVFGKAADLLKQIEQLVLKQAAEGAKKHKGRDKKVCFAEPLDKKLPRLTQLHASVASLVQELQNQLAKANEAIFTIIQRREEKAHKAKLVPLKPQASSDSLSSFSPGPCKSHKSRCASLPESVSSQSPKTVAGRVSIDCQTSDSLSQFYWLGKSGHIKGWSNFGGDALLKSLCQTRSQELFKDDYNSLSKALEISAAEFTRLIKPLKDRDLLTPMECNPMLLELSLEKLPGLESDFVFFQKDTQFAKQYFFGITRLVFKPEFQIEQVPGFMREFLLWISKKIQLLGRFEKRLPDLRAKEVRDDLSISYSRRGTS